MAKHCYLILLFFVSFLYTTGQNRNSVWCFGDSAGIDFSNVSNPLPIVSGMDGRGSCTNIADSLGNLLFYGWTKANTAGSTGRIFNKLHQTMDNGDSLIGEGWYEELVIIPKPNDAGKYYLFSVGVVGFPYGLYYSIIDMNQNGGLGKVIFKNTQLHSLEALDGITAIKHGNGRDWWLIFKLSGYQSGANNTFYAYLISPSGISPPSIQAIGSNTSTNAGFLSFSRGGNKFLLSSARNLLEIFDFDRCTGQLSNPIIIEPELSIASGNFLNCCFSPNDSIVYVSSYGGGAGNNHSYLIQYNLYAGNISSSKDTIADFLKPAALAGLRLGPDNKIYVSASYEFGIGNSYPYPDSVRNSTNMNLSVINSPDSLGTACDFQPFSFYLGGKRTYYGLPNNPDYEMGPWVGSGCDSLTTTIDNGQLTIDKIQVYPNPVNNGGEVAFTYSSTGEAKTISIFNTDGQEVVRYGLPQWSSVQRVKLPQLAKGVYMARIQSKEQSASVKFMVE